MQKKKKIEYFFFHIENDYLQLRSPSGSVLTLLFLKEGIQSHSNTH